MSATQIFLGGVDRSGMTGTQLADEVIGGLGERLSAHRDAGEQRLLDIERDLE